MAADNSMNTQQVDLLLIRTLIDKYNKSQTNNKDLKKSILTLEQSYAQLKQQIDSHQQTFDKQTNQLKTEHARAMDTLKSENKLLLEQATVSSQQKMEQLTQELSDMKASYSAIITRIRGQ